ERVVQVDEHHVIATLGSVVVEGDGANALRERMLEPIETPGPRACERRHLEHACIGQVRELHRRKVGLLGERQGDTYHALNAVGSQVLLVARRTKTLVELGNALTKLAIGLNVSPCSLDAPF